MPTRPKERTGGWDDDRLLNVAAVDDDLRCPICASLIRDAFQCNAQHTFCATCIHKWLTTHATCPLGNESLTPDKLTPARFVRQAVDKHQARCEHTPHGCAKVSTIETIDAHERACGYRHVPCAHAKQGCQVVLCHHDMATHEDVCGFANICCRHCMHHMLRRDETVHRDDLGCVKVLVQRIQDLERSLKQAMHQQSIEEMRHKVQIHDLNQAVRVTVGYIQQKPQPNSAFVEYILPWIPKQLKISDLTQAVQLLVDPAAQGEAAARQPSQ